MSTTSAGSDPALPFRVTAGFTIRPAVASDAAELRELMRAATDILQTAYLSPAQIKASHRLMGLDTQLIADGGYVVAEGEDSMIGCGGWSRRETLYGGDDSAVARAPRLLDPSSEAARIRAMYTRPGWTRRGVGSAILRTCEDAAAAAGFRNAELMATLSGEPLYLRFGYARVEEVIERVDGVAVPFVRMRKTLADPLVPPDTTASVQALG